MPSSLSVKAGLTRSLYRILGIAVILGTFLVFVWVFGDAIRSAGGLKPERWPPFIGCDILHLQMLFILIVLWERVLAFLWSPINGSVLPSKSTLYTAYSRSWLARYIPGRIWSLAGRTILVNRLGVPADQVARSIVIEVVLAYGMLTIISGSILSWVYLHPLIAVTTFAFGVIFFGASVIKIGNLSKDNTLQSPPISLTRMVSQKAATLLTGGSYFSCNFTLKGLGLYGAYSFMQLAFIVLIAASFTDLNASRIAVISGALGLSLTVGWLSVFPPVGLGARDGLAFLLFSQVVELPAASSIVVASRLLMLSTDLVFVMAVESTTKIHQRFGLTKIRIKNGI